MSDPTTTYISDSINLIRNYDKLGDKGIMHWISIFLHQEQYWMTDEEEQYLVSYVRLSLENSYEH